MSYILNALKKSEQERQTGEVPSLSNSFTEHQIKPKRWTPWLVIALVLITLMLIAVIWLNWREPNITSAKTEKIAEQLHLNKKPLTAAPDTPAKNQLLNLPATTVSDNHPIQSIVEKTEPSISEIVQKKRQQTIKQEITADKEIGPPLPAVTSPNLQKQTAVAKEKPATAVDPVAKESTPPETITDAGIMMDESTDETLMAEIPLSETEHIEPPSAAETEADAPKLSELSLEFRRQVPDLNINVFVYADDPKDRFVIIDMIKYTPNAQIAEGMELEQILNDSLVVDYRGKTFRIMRP